MTLYDLAIAAGARAMCDRVNGVGDFDRNIAQRRAGWFAQAKVGIDAYLAALADEPDSQSEDDAPCTDCEDTGLTIQTERPCSCLSGIKAQVTSSTDKARLERVARAIHATRRATLPYDQIAPLFRQGLLNDAEAAVAELSR